MGFPGAILNALLIALSLKLFLYVEDVKIKDLSIF